MGESLTASLMRGGSTVMGTFLANKALTLISAVLLARLLGTEGYGKYAFAIAILNLITIPAQMGVPRLSMREIARSCARSEWALLRGFRRRALQMSLISTIVGAVVIGGGIFVFSDGLEAFDAMTFAAALFLLPLFVGLALASSFLRGLRKVVHGNWPNNVLQPALFVVFLFAMAQGLSAPSAVLLNALSNAAALGVTIWLLVKYWPRETSAVEPEYRTSDWAKSLLPFSLLAGARLITQKSDIIMLGAMTSAASVGIYNIAIQAAALVAIPLSASNAVLAPNIARLHALGDMRGLQRLLTNTTMVVSGLSLIGCIILVGLGQWLLQLFFGNDFIGAYGAMAVLAVGQVINASAGSIGQFLSMTGHEKDTVKVIGGSAILNIVLNAILIPPYGILGAAIATSASLATWNIALSILLYRRLGLIAGPVGKFLAKRA